MEPYVGQFFLGCNCPVRRGIVEYEQDKIGEIPGAYLLQYVLQLYQQR
jgi:hypothetical protein